MADPLDEELIGLLNRLNKVQKEIGGGKKEKNLATENQKLDRFIDLYDRMNERLEKIKNAIDEIRKLERVPGSNPRDLITQQGLVRTELAAASDEWRELDTIYRLETKKKRSRFTAEQLEARQQMLLSLQTAIQEIKDIQRQGYVKAYQGRKLVTMEESEIFRKRDVETGQEPGAGAGAGAGAGGAGDSIAAMRGVVGKRNNNMTDEHRQALMLIKDRDAKIDDEIEEIGKGVDILRELALAANEEIKVQNRMLDTLEEKVNEVGDTVNNLNSKLKDTLEKVRASDKICLDIFCVMILIGMIIVLVKLNSDAKARE